MTLVAVLQWAPSSDFKLCRAQRTGRGEALKDVRTGEPFGLDPKTVAAIDWTMALRRTIHDTRSDFIYAPHLGFAYKHAGNALIARLQKQLNAGKFSPGIPLTLDVPKSHRLRVVGSRRPGPAFSRPGSILLPADRLLYQVFADQALQAVENGLDRSRSFSHQPTGPKSDAMFRANRECWSDFQTALQALAGDDALQYVLRLDVGNYFGSLNQHTLISQLEDAGYPKPLRDRLEISLTRYSGTRSSRGILQGLYPSDLFGNFYLAPIDQFLDDIGVPSVRYVDDIYVFVASMEQADTVVRRLFRELRTYDLTLNEAKSIVLPKKALISEEPDLESLFSDAVDEIRDQLDDDGFDVDYGFQVEWQGARRDSSDLELSATTQLFNSIDEYPGQEEKIERFCLPLFLQAGSDHAVDHVITAFSRRPSMAQLYSAYLAYFADVPQVAQFLTTQIECESNLDWQHMWTLAALSQCNEASKHAVKAAARRLGNADGHEALRAVAAVFIGQFGDHSRRKALVATYAALPPFIRSAIYYSSREWPKVERKNARASWGADGELNELLTIAFDSR